MRRLTSALRDAGEAGEALPAVFEQFEQNGVQLRLGELHLIASAPGVGKSLLANTIAVRAGVPCMYVSADTSAHTTSVRIASMLSGHPQAFVQQHLKDSYKYQDLLASVDHIRWSFTPCPTIDDIKRDIESFAVLWGDFPSLIVIDNLRNIYSDEEDWSAMRHNAEALMIMARETGSAVLALHHLTGAYDDGSQIPPLSALEGKVSKLPSLCLNLFIGRQNGDIGVAVVKNRHGQSSPGGQSYFFLKTDYERVRIG